MVGSRPPYVGIVDYGMGNLVSVTNAFQFLGARTGIINSAKDFSNIDAVVLPGVGAFGQAMENLCSLDLIGPLTETVMERRVPFFGICLGMQMLANSSSEMGDHAGFGWINSQVEHLGTASTIRVPHVAWSRLDVHQNSALFTRLKKHDSFYFDHSYRFSLNTENVIAYSDYNGPIPAVIERDNIFATQFHPEKSQRAGLMLLRNFLNIVTGQKVFSA